MIKNIKNMDVIIKPFINNNGKLNKARLEQHRLNRFLEKVSTDATKDNFLKSAEGKYVLSLENKLISGFLKGLLIMGIVYMVGKEIGLIL